MSDPVGGTQSREMSRVTSGTERRLSRDELAAGLLSPEELARIKSRVHGQYAIHCYQDRRALLAHLRVLEAERDELAKIVDDLAEWWELDSNVEGTEELDRIIGEAMRAHVVRSSKDRVRRAIDAQEGNEVVVANGAYDPEYRKADQ